MAKLVFIDNNVWDLLFALGLDLANELPREEFQLSITREAEFEIEALPIEKVVLKQFIQSTIERLSIPTDSYFGFHNPDHIPKEQRAGGFNIGRFASQAEVDFMRRQNALPRNRKMLKSRLYKHEADVSLAARSVHWIVLTLDTKSGPLNDARKHGHSVVFLDSFDHTKSSLANFIRTQLHALS